MVQFSLNKGGGFDRDTLTRMRSIYPPENSSLGRVSHQPFLLKNGDGRFVSGLLGCYWLYHTEEIRRNWHASGYIPAPEATSKSAGEIPAVARSLKIHQFKPPVKSPPKSHIRFLAFSENNLIQSAIILSRSMSFPPPLGEGWNQSEVRGLGVLERRCSCCSALRSFRGFTGGPLIFTRGST